MTAAMKLTDACSLEEKPRQGIKPMTNLDKVLKNRDISLLSKVFIVKAMVFLVVI